MTKAEQAEFRRSEKVRLAHQAFMMRTGNVYRHQTERLRKLSGQGDAKLPFSLDQFREWFQNGLDSGCYYTGEPLKLKTAAVDHKIAVTRGGKWDLPNMALCDERVNLQKGMLREDEYRELRSVISHFAPVAQADVKRRLTVGGRWSK